MKVVVQQGKTESAYHILSSSSSFLRDVPPRGRVSNLNRPRSSAAYSGLPVGCLLDTLGALANALSL